MAMYLISLCLLLCACDITPRDANCRCYYEHYYGGKKPIVCGYCKIKWEQEKKHAE